MYYSFYMNERLLLDNWKYYDDSNWLLKVCLAKDDTKDRTEKKRFYLANRHERDSWERDYYNSKEFKRNYYEYISNQWDYEHNRDYYNSFGGETRKNPYFDRYTFMKNNADVKWRISGTKLREIDTVYIYKSDIEIIDIAKRDHNFTVKELKLLLGLYSLAVCIMCSGAGLAQSLSISSFAAVSISK